MSFRDTASFGKRQEFVAIAELLRRGFDVYQTLVDAQGFDCIVRLDSTRYVDIQVKARSRAAKHPFFFAAMTVDPRPNLFFLFYTELSDTSWIMPSSAVDRFGHRNKAGKNAGKVSLTLPRSLSGLVADRFERYRDGNGFSLLRAWPAEPPAETLPIRPSWCTKRLNLNELPVEYREYIAELVRDLKPGDELWEYDEPAPPGVNAGEIGVVVLRSGVAVARIITGVH